MAQTNTVKFTFKHEVNGQELKLNETLFPIWNGKMVRLDRAEFYLAEIVLIDENGASIPMNDQYILAKANEPAKVWTLGDVNTDQISGIKMGLGVDAARNHLDPSVYPADHPLSFQDPSMHWGWTAGYRFMAIEGYVDNNNDGIPESLFQYHNLGDNLYKKINLTGSVSAQNGVLQVDYILDYAKLFDGMPLVGNLIHHGSDSQNGQMLENGATKGFVAMPQVSSNEEIDHQSSSLKAFPNPAIGTVVLQQDLSITAEHVEIKVMNLAGQVIHSIPQVPSKGTVELNVSSWIPGTYIYGLYDGHQLIGRNSFIVHE